MNTNMDSNSKAPVEFSQPENIAPPLKQVEPIKEPPRLAFSVSEAAQMLGVSEKSVRRLVLRGLLKPSRALRHLRFTQTEIERFLRETM